MRDGDVAAGRLDKDGLRTPNILKMKLGRRMPEEGVTVMERLSV